MHLIVLGASGNIYKQLNKKLPFNKRTTFLLQEPRTGSNSFYSRMEPYTCCSLQAPRGHKKVGQQARSRTQLRLLKL